ncbi:MAG: hypothetical protein QW379_04485 [Thermoplasmata archaeon]
MLEGPKDSDVEALLRKRVDQSGKIRLIATTLKNELFPRAESMFVAEFRSYNPLEDDPEKAGGGDRGSHPSGDGRHENHGRESCHDIFRWNSQRPPGPDIQKTAGVQEKFSTRFEP